MLILQGLVNMIFLEKMWLKNRGILVSQYDIKMFFYDYVQYNNVIH